MQSRLRRVPFNVLRTSPILPHISITPHCCREKGNECFPFLTVSNCLFLIKLSFSKWSEVWPMKSISSSGLLFSAAPHIPWHITWLQHKYEHVESTSVNEFRVLQKVRMVSTDGNSPWTLWSLMDHAMEFIEPASEITDARSEEPIRHPCDEPGCNCSFFRWASINNWCFGIRDVKLPASFDWLQKICTQRIRNNLQRQ